MEAFGWQLYSPGYILDIRMEYLAEKMVNEPEKFLNVLWKRTNYNFKKKFNDKSTN